MNLVNNKSEISSNGIALDGNNIDTDQIIPARFLKELSFCSLGKNVFIDERKLLGNNNQLHPFDEPKRANAKILAVAKNFGCGSSREHAPQAIKRWGIDVVAGESFGEIFRGNCASIGLACLTVSEHDSKALRGFIKKNPEVNIVVDFTHKKMSFGNDSVAFSIKETLRQRIVSGNWNMLADLLKYKNNTDEVFKRLPYTHGEWKFQ